MKEYQKQNIIRRMVESLRWCLESLDLMPVYRVPMPTKNDPSDK